MTANLWLLKVAGLAGKNNCTRLTTIAKWCFVLQTGNYMLVIPFLYPSFIILDINMTLIKVIVLIHINTDLHILYSGRVNKEFRRSF